MRKWRKVRISPVALETMVPARDDKGAMSALRMIPTRFLRSSAGSWNPSSHELTLRTTLMRPFADHLVQSADAATGPWSDVVTGTISWPASVEIVVPNATSPYYRVVAVP